MTRKVKSEKDCITIYICLLSYTSDPQVTLSLSKPILRVICELSWNLL